MNRNTLVRAASAFAFVGLVATSAGAQTSAPPATPAPASTMNFQQVTDRLTAQGFNDIREIERKSDKLYEIKARDEKGQSVELYVDARSGEVLRREVKRFGD